MVRVFWGCIAVLVAVTAAVFLLPSGGDTPSDGATARRVNTPARDATAAAEPPLDAARPATPVRDATVPEEQPGGIGVSVPQPGRIDESVPGENATLVAPTVNPPTDMPNPETDVIPRSDDTGRDAGPGEPVGSPTVAPALDEDPGTDAKTAEPPPAPLTDPVDLVAEPSDAADQARRDAAETDAPAETGDETAEGATTANTANNADEEATLVDDSDPALSAAEPVASAPTDAPQTGTPARIETPIGGTEKSEETERAEPAVTTPTGLLLDGQWSIEGEGTADKPYQIEWDMLVALQRDYMPRLGKTEIPAWMQALNGKTVTIRGYALLPMGVSSLTELLVMLNQWDSCCIGVPPTPYDAIEVRLAKPLSASAQSMFSHTGALSFGDITGTLKIDPYIVQGYLLGLYLMEDASANLLGPAGTP